MIIVGAMTAKLTAALRLAPATVPALAAVALFVVWASDQAGYPATHWAPGAVLLLALLGTTIALLGLGLRAIPKPTQLALAAFAAFTAYSYLSILWAAVPGDAWEGANRTLLYLLAFGLFACWRQRGAGAGLLLAAWTLAITALAALALLHVDGAGAAQLQSLLPSGRLVYPSGYANANAAQWLMAFWPAVLLARSARVPWALRGLLAGGAVLLACVALLSQSRGSLYATPAMLALVFAAMPERVRTFALLLPIAIGIGAAAPSLLRVGDHLSNGAVSPANVHSASAAILIAALLVGLVVAGAAAVESRLPISEGAGTRIHRGLGAVALACLLLAVAGGLAVGGDPVSRVRDSWNSFKGGYGANSQTGTRLVSGLGSNRYDFYRVALDEFLAHPVIGIGADNFQQQYLAHGRSQETPHYPHSVELRTLAQMGALGTLLALLGLGAALLAAGRAMRGSDPLGRTVAAAALSGFVYWVVHGSFDWFWEFAGLGAPAFALLGIACALQPAPRSAAALTGQGSPQPTAGNPPGAPPRERPRPPALFAGALAGLALALSLVTPWLSQLQVQSAARIFARSPRAAYARLEEAARLNPLSDLADTVAGSIALRYGDLPRADREFARALERSPGDSYATLERGAIASFAGERARALVLLARAAHLNPRDPLTREALAIARAGRRLSVARLNRSILVGARQFS